MRPPLILALTLILCAAALADSARAAARWRWTCEGEGFAASGEFTTADAPDADGFYEITAIKGEVNGVAITGLQPKGTSIPGNDGYPVDNLVRRRAPQISVHGFGFSLADKTWVNPFHGAHFAAPGPYALLSDPATGRTREPSVTFTASQLR